jgi:signal transduction histidine kinase
MVMVLMGAGIWVALDRAAAVRESAAGLVREQLLTARLLNDVQVEENALTEVLHRVARAPSNLDRRELLADLARADEVLERLAQETRHAPEAAVWGELRNSAARFTEEVRRVLRGPLKASREELDQLFGLHDNVVQLSRTLLDATNGHLSVADALIEKQSRDLAGKLTLVLGTCFLLASGCAAGTLTYARHSIRRIESQSDELNKVSWHMLQSQETTARRFAHELHDELGQSLAAVRSHLTIGRDREDPDQARAECVKLVDEAIENVRSLAQLLRPVILDDFGLAAGLRWLADGFAQRTRMQVECELSEQGRLHMDTETHLFRIAQEAFTNIARHSQATAVQIALTRVGDDVRLAVEDNGRGLGLQRGQPTHSLGLVGMRARARECGGKLRMEDAAPSGLRIVVDVPARAPEENGGS